jgi:hypothetical protein
VIILIIVSVNFLYLYSSLGVSEFSYKMSVCPTLLKDIRKTAIHNHQKNIGNGSYNRYDVLSDRPRTFSTGKRPRSSDTDGDQIPKTPKLDSNTIFSQLSGQDEALKEMEKHVKELDSLNSNPDIPKDPRITCLSAIIKLLVIAQGSLTSTVLDSVKILENKQPPGKSSNASIPLPGFKKGSGKASSAVPDSPDIPPEKVLKKKVQQTLRDAEKRTVLFNLNLGTAPMMNKTSISKQVTVAISNKVKTGKHDYHIGDAEDVLDDILSCSKLEFLGNTTKKYFNNKNLNDPMNDKMYSIPVRMDFKDRDTRMQSEIHLRKICKVSCSVPYPKKLQQMIGDLVKAGKGRFLDFFIRTKVNIDKMMVEAHDKTGEGWVDLNLVRPIPLNILDNNPLSFSNFQTVQQEMEDADEEVSLF